MKSQKKKNKENFEVNNLPQTDAAQENISEARNSALDSYWLIACLSITAVAVFTRFFKLELKPLHHDEGVNGYFLITLFRDGIYKYDPSNYHGPDLYYLALAFAKIFGLNTWSIRSSVAIFGVFTVILAFFLRKYIGTIGSLTAALLIALSPGMVYISRYFIHEILFVFFSFAIVVGVLYFIEKREAGIFAVSLMTLLLLVCFLPTALNLANAIGRDSTVIVWIARIALFAVEAVLVFLIMRMLLAWNGGAPIYLLLASASTALLFATKETAFITIGTMMIAVVCVWIWRKIFRALIDEPKENELEPVELTWDNFRARLGKSSDLLLISIACFLAFAYVGILFFSSFFTYPEGVKGAFEAYALWTKTGSKDHTQNGMLAYAKWLMKIESPIVLLSVIGILIAFFKARHRFAMFTGLWAFGLFLAYTIIPYKTPWLALSFILPMCIAGGYAVNELFASRDTLVKIAGGILLTASVAILGFQTYDLNFERYDDDSMPYVYAHTRREFLDLINRVEHYAEKSGKGKQASVEIISQDYWSMPWYLREYPKAIFHGRFVDANTSEMIVASEKQIDELNERYGTHYKYEGKYALRPGVDLLLLVRRDLADTTAQELNRIGDETP